MTGIRVAFPSSSESMLWCVGAKCCTRTNAIPVLPGRARRSCSKASSPPADAPMPTIEEGECRGVGETLSFPSRDGSARAEVFFGAAAIFLWDLRSLPAEFDFLIGMRLLQTFEAANYSDAELTTK